MGLLNRIARVLLMAALILIYVVDDGLEWLARYANQSTAGSFQWMALDDGTTVEAAGTTVLTSEITTGGGERKVCACTYEASYKSVWYAAFTFTDSFSIEGCAIFNQLVVAGSKMLMCHLFSTVKNVDTGNIMQLTMKLTQAR
jgi:hypothetical protein